MKTILECRRSIIAIFAISCLAAINLYKGTDCSSAIAAVAIGLAGANSAEGIFSKTPKDIVKGVKKIKEIKD
jgi:hypothetical protein